MRRKFGAAAIFVLLLFPAGMVCARPTVYIGMEVGYTSLNHLVELGISTFPGLQLTPVLGIVPVAGLPGFSVEFNFMTELFGWKSQVPPQELEARVMSPQLLAVYTFLDDQPVKPFAALGVGVNINSATYSRNVWDTKRQQDVMTASSVEIPVSPSVVLKGGVRVAVPRTGLELLALLRYNVNFVGNVWLDGELLLAAMNATSFSLGLGACYRL